MARKPKEAAPKAVKEDSKPDEATKPADKGQNYDQYWSTR